ncbi:YciI family protein [Streptomyces sp. NPDC052225]|uniref:YciI family protein n=1 Tax=Streptomyces sp. NPDC052225 TaxID=3154949 RepID=UPI0034253D0F
MFVLELTYTAPIEHVDALMEEHRAWLDGHFTAGTFLAAGRKQPRDGGIIIAAGDDRPAVEQLTATDPFVTGGVCAYRITEFVAVKTAPELASFRQELPAG